MMEVSNGSALSDLRKSIRTFHKRSLVIFILAGAIMGGIEIVKYSISKMEWDKLKNDCELSAILNNSYYQYACKIDSNLTTVINDKLDDLHWEKFRTKNHCYIEYYNLTLSKNKKKWSCDNNVTIYNDKN